MPVHGWTAFPYRLLRAVKRRWLSGRHRPAPPTPRANYKQTWNSLAVSEDDAKLGVAGHVDEAKLEASTNATLTVLRRTVGIRPGDTILEIGAGVGRVGRALAPLCKEWIGADVSENMLGHLRRRLREFPNVRAVALNGYDLGPIADASVDLVYCTVVFMHLEEWERYRYVREAFRVLRPGGRMLVDNCTIVTDDGWAMFEQLLSLNPLDRPTQVSKTSTPQELETYFRRAGFRDIRQQLEELWVYTYGIKPA